jgi:hypothetical protein
MVVASMLEIAIFFMALFLKKNPRMAGVRL